MERMNAVPGAEGLDPKVVMELLSALEIQNVADEDEPQGLFKIGGVEVIPRQSVNIISAQKKSGKTNLAGLLMAACISKEGHVLGGLVRARVSNKVDAAGAHDKVDAGGVHDKTDAAGEDGPRKILFIDTEQPLRDARRTLRRMMKTAGYEYSEPWNDHGITILTFKNIDQLEKVAVRRGEEVEELPKQWVLMEEAVKYHQPDLFVIDGLADMLSTVNDEAEARELMRFLDRLACDYNCAVIGMLHLNYGSGKIGGWAGTQANKKFTDCFTLRKKNGFFEGTHEGRGAEAPKFRFRITCPMGDRIGWWEAVDDNDPAVTCLDLKRQECITALEGAPLPCRHGELIKWVMQKEHNPCKSSAENFLRQCKEFRILDSKKDGRTSIWFWLNECADEEEELEFDD